MSIYIRIIEALWFILPAYVANSAPVQVTKIPYLEKFSTPIDFGKRFKGKRIFGDSKTWRGLVLGVLFGTLIGILQTYFQGDASEFFKAATLPEMSPQLAFMLSFGALIGDLVGSFVKRRMGFEPGAHAPLLDQLNFIFGAYFFAYLLTFTIDYDQFFVVLVITPTIHLFFNFIAWIYKLKKYPW
jgi:CDP-2,3-bis-(O-geranylgeranyl)-sn-glycerol synthase